ncbi:MAG: protein kinase [Gemmatimonadetes bacterium]|nr:protein kinase [Gemmatimonadota bacterium]
MRKDDVVLHYRIAGVLGRGGMGEVYLAEDTRLKRRVALKMLPEDLADDPALLQRFRVEAEAAARLNHPNIAQVYAIEEARMGGPDDPDSPDDAESGSGGQDSSGTMYFITMEYVSGRPLHEHLGGAPLPLDSFYDWFIPIADALDHAHERGVVHRDLKPANVMISEKGVPKILDFGLARVVPGSSGETDGAGPTMSLTQAGTVMGTPAYMSPEQATGSHGDQRSDIFSLGVMMYEALTGVRPFTGENYVSVISSTLKDDPEPVSASNIDVPPMLNRVVRRCLAKEPRSRYQSVLDVGHDLSDSREEYEAGPSGTTGPSKAERPVSLLRNPAMLAACAVGIAGVALGIAGLSGLLPAETPLPVRKFQITLDNLGRDNVAISPDGTMLAFTRDSRLWVRPLDQIEGREISGTEDVDRVFWSPGSRYIGYLSARSIWKVGADGDGQVHLCDLPDQRLTGISWGGDGQIIFSMSSLRTGGGLYAVSEHGGVPVLLAEPDETKSERALATPLSLSDHNLRLFSVALTEDDSDVIANLSEQYRGNAELSQVITVGRISGSRIVAESPGYGRRTLSLEGDFLGVAGFASGHLVYYRETTRAEGDLWAVPFSPRIGELTGEAFPVVRHVNSVSLSTDGTMVYRPAFRPRQQLAVVNRRGRIERVIGSPQEWIGDPVLSPEGMRVIADARDGNLQGLWLYDFESGAESRLTFDDRDYSKPTYTSDGGSIVFAVSRSPNPGRFRRDGLLMRMDLDAMEEMTPFSTDSLTGWEPIMSGDGSKLVFFKRQSIQYLSTEGDAEPEVLIENQRRVFQGALSPDGRYLAYVSSLDGSPEVYVTRFPTGSGRWRVSVKGGWTPRWNPSGDELFYVEDNRMMSVPLLEGQGFRFGPPRVLFDGIQGGADYLRFSGFDVTGDGQKFILPTNAEEERPVLTIIENWPGEFGQ